MSGARGFGVWLGVVGVAVWLVSCAQVGVPSPSPGVVLPTVRSVDAVPTLVSVGAALPGRLLFVKGGDVWLWQGERGVALTSGGGAFQPVWSPDGREVAYVERGESFSDVVVMAAGGGGVRRLTDNGSGAAPHSYERIGATVWAFYPAWSPDGDEVAFASQYGPPAGSPAADYHMGLFRVARGGGVRVQLYADDGGHVGRLVYAPDGSIVFGYAPVGGGGALLYRYMRAGGVVPVPGLPEQRYDPAFSPDGRWLAFAGRDGGHTDVFVMAAGGGAPVRLTSLGGARAPAFSPDGSQVAFLAIAPGGQGFDLWVVGVQRGADGVLHALQVRQVTSGAGIDADSGVSWGR